MRSEVLRIHILDLILFVRIILNLLHNPLLLKVVEDEVDGVQVENTRKESNEKHIHKNEYKEHTQTKRPYRARGEIT